MTIAQRTAELDRLRRILPPSPEWEAWLRQSGELPPDFDALPRVPGLPDPLLQEGNGRATRITCREEWPRRRERLLELFQRYVIGTVPPPPGNVRGTVLAERPEAGATVREVALAFGPGHRATLSLELYVPKGSGPFPVFLTQAKHRAWAVSSVSRGYLACVFAGADVKDDTAGFVPVWPEHDWTNLTRRAWAAGRCIDYLETVPEADATRIGMAGHSRDGKQTLIAAALDERIGAAVLSSSGAGGACSFRFFSESQFGEAIELLTRVFPDWMHPRLRFFAGREDRLPIDQHELVALLAPRPCLISTGLNDHVDSAWAIEQTYLAAKPVYALLGAEERLRLLWRSGEHDSNPDVIGTYLDWFDRAFGRGQSEFPERLLYPCHADWAHGGERLDAPSFPQRGLGNLAAGDRESWPAQREEIRERVRWGLGEEPPRVVNSGGPEDSDYHKEFPYRAVLLRRDALPAGIAKQSINFGENVAGDMYVAAEARDRGDAMPAFLWLHPHSNSTGYVAGYRRGEQTYLHLAREGFAVFAFDGIGHGHRVDEARRFYDRYPRWSLLGRMVRDVQAAVDALERFPGIDASRIYFFGYGLGGMVGLHAAALDARIAGGVSIAGFTPMRLDAPEKGTGGVARLSHWHALQPRLGAFIGHEARIPYDYHEVIALIAPRPLLVVSPRLDRENTVEDIQECLHEASKVYARLGAPGNLQHEAPDDYHRLSPERRSEALRRFKEMIAIGEEAGQ